MCMPWLGHVDALVEASGPSLISSLLKGIGGGRNGSVGRTIQCANRVPSPSPTAPSFAPNASIAVSTHSRLTNGLWYVMRFGSRCGKYGARRGIARSRAQKFGNPVRLRLAAIRSIRVTRFDESSSAAAHPPRCHRRHPHGVTGDTIRVSQATPRYSSLSLLVLRFLLSAVLYLVGFELADGFVATSVLLLRTSSRGMPRSR